MRRKPLGIEPPEPVLFRPTSQNGLKVFCPEMKAYIIFQDEERRDRWFKRYQTQDALRINGIAAQSRRVYDQIRKFRMINLILIIALSTVGCKKCAECTTTVVIKATGQPTSTGISQSELCGDDLKEADGFYNVATATSNGYTSTITTSIECQ